MSWMALAASAAISWGLYGASLHRGQTELGVALRIKKANDIGHYPPDYLHLYFDSLGLVGATPTTAAHWPELANTKGMSPRDRLIEYMKTIIECTAADAAKATGLDHTIVGGLFANTPFVRTRVAGRVEYYGLNPLWTPPVP